MSKKIEFYTKVGKTTINCKNNKYLRIILSQCIEKVAEAVRSGKFPYIQPVSAEVFKTVTDSLNNMNCSDEKFDKIEVTINYHKTVLVLVSDVEVKIVN